MKRQIARFFLSFFVSACVIVLVFSIVTVDKNAVSVLNKAPSKVFEVSLNSSQSSITVNDKRISFSSEKITDSLFSRELLCFSLVWLMI